MHMLVAAIGKAKPNAPEMVLFHDYAKRLRGLLTLKETDIKTSDASVRLEKETQWVLAAAKPYPRLIVLDERGDNLSTKALADTLQNWQQQGVSSAAFAIGGADGVGQAVREQADLLLSFGRATWPHMLVRAMVAEQIYRVHSLWAGHPYHRE